jgi:hypothetical protein
MMNHPFGTGGPSSQPPNQFSTQRGHFVGNFQQNTGGNTGFVNNDMYAQLQMLQQHQIQQQYMNGFGNNPGTPTPPTNVLGGGNFSGAPTSGRIVIVRHNSITHSHSKNPQQQQIQQLLQNQPSQPIYSNTQNALYNQNQQSFMTQQPMQQIQQTQQAYNIIGGQGGYGNTQGPVMNAINTNLTGPRNNSFSVDQIKTVRVDIRLFLKIIRFNSSLSNV